MTTLDDFSDDSSTDGPEPPVVRKVRPVDPRWLNKRVGTLGVALNREGYAYVSPRTRERHLYRNATNDPKTGGYAVSERLVGWLERRSVVPILVKERDTDDVFEFRLDQFKEPDLVLDHDDRQACVRTTRAVEVWRGLGSNLWSYTPGGGEADDG